MRNIRRSLALIFLFFSLSAAANFDFNPHCIKAYKEIFSLRLNTARTLIDAEKKRNPKNAIPYLLDNYLDYFTILTSESRSDFDKLKDKKSDRLDRIESDDKSSPYYLFAQAEIHLQWALTNGFFQEYFASSIELNKAYRMLQDNHRKFPSFLPNQKDLGMLNAVLGSLPDGLKRTVSVFGMKGNTQTGVKILENLVSDLPGSAYAHFYDDAVFCLAYVKTDIQNDYTAYPKIVSIAQKIDSSSLLKTYILSYSALRTGHSDDAVTAVNNKPLGVHYQYFPNLDYIAGVARMRKLDNSASKYFQSYLQNYKGKNYIKDSYLSLAWLSLIKGNNAEYQDYIRLVKTKGFTVHEKDKQALQEANDPAPAADLIKARLLFDGGYYTKALSGLADKRAGDFKLLRDKIEFCYRLGRIYDETEKDSLALKFYQFAITLGSKERYYFASNAALRMAIIYEKKKNYAQSKSFYHTAIDMKDHDYERSIETKAKEGLRRIGG